MVVLFGDKTIPQRAYFFIFLLFWSEEAFKELSRSDFVLLMVFSCAKKPEEPSPLSYSLLQINLKISIGS